MSKDTIYRQDAIDSLDDEITITGISNAYVFKDYVQRVKRKLEQLPSVQSEIIVCADCKHWVRHDRRCGYWNHGVKQLDWCCHAERRTDE